MLRRRARRGVRREVGSGSRFPLMDVGGRRARRLGLIEALLIDGPGPRGLRVALALAYAVPLLWRRQAPLVLLGVICGLLVARALTADVPEGGTMPFPCMLVAILSVAPHGRPLALAAPAVAVPIGAMLATITTDHWVDGPAPGDVAILTFFVAGAWALGRTVRQRTAQARGAEARSASLALRAVSAERARIARELHDVVAHSGATPPAPASTSAMCARPPARRSSRCAGCWRCCARTRPRYRPSRVWRAWAS